MKKIDRTKKRREIRKRHRLRMEENRQRKLFLKISRKPKYKIAAVAIVIILVSCGLFYYLQNPADVPEPSLIIGDENSPFKSAIIDQLSLSHPNQDFVEESIDILRESGFSIYYYEGDRCTVELLRSLPTHGFNLIILRVHSSVAQLKEEEFKEIPVIFFTSESYSTSKYVSEQLTDQLTCGSLDLPNPPYYFTIRPKFVTYSMEGEFHNTTIITMGCNGATNLKMAVAFIRKGAKAYIGWDNPVDIHRTDTATICLLNYLLIQKKTFCEAIESTNEDIGPDPVYGSEFISCCSAGSENTHVIE